jgi:hypothetical protein
MPHNDNRPLDRKSDPEPIRPEVEMETTEPRRLVVVNIMKAFCNHRFAYTVVSVSVDILNDH